MSKKVLLESAIHRLRSELLENVAAMDNLLSHPVNNAVDEIIECAMDAVQAEAAIHTLQQYFGHIISPPAPQPIPQPPPKPASNKPPLVVTPERSPTLRKSLENAERTKKGKKKTPKSKEKREE